MGPSLVPSKFDQSGEPMLIRDVVFTSTGFVRITSDKLDHLPSRIRDAYLVASGPLLYVFSRFAKKASGFFR